MKKQIKKLSTLAMGSLAVILLLGTSLAQADEQVCMDGDTATGIKNLMLVTEQFGQVEVNVDFKYTTSFEVYGPELDGFPFTEFAEEDASVAMQTINEALNDHMPVPSFVGLSDETAFYIGQEEGTGLYQGLIAAWGGANYSFQGDLWQPCTQDGSTSCTSGATTLSAVGPYTYADLTLSDGSSCDGGPPPTGFDIVPGTTGSYFDPARDGEGYNFEVLGTPGDYQLYAYFYTYDDTGNQMWVTGTGPVNGGTAVVEMLVTSGAVFGDDFDKDDVIREEWGTMTFSFSSCTIGSVDYVSNNFGSGTVDFDRLTYVAGLACP